MSLNTVKILRLTNNSSKVLNDVRATLQKGGLVIFPSDTVYGLLVDATNEKAVRKLIEFKNRPAGKAISVFVADFPMLKDVVQINKNIEERLRQLLPGPFTVILNSKHKTSKLLESEKGTLGVRLPDYERIQSLVKQFGKPVTATSANLSGHPPHYSVDALLKDLPEKKKTLIDLVVDAGKLSRNKPSTIIDLTTSKVRLIRRGDIVFSDAETLVSKSPSQTKKIAQYILRKVKVKSKKEKEALVFILQGELGVGKTIFVKGIGETLGITNIISPTFVVYYEYDMKDGKLVHVDLYNLQDEGEFEHLGLEKYLKPGNILCFEWGEKAGRIIGILHEKARVVYVKMRYIDEKKRELTIQTTE